MSARATTARAGRPTAATSAQLGALILDVATAAFLRDGYAATSIEAVAKRARVGKRTLYARFGDKESLFRAVLDRLMERWLAASPDPEPAPGGIGPALVQLAGRILDVALQPEAIALHRLLVSEAGRFPEILRMLQGTGFGEGASRVSALLEREVRAGRLPLLDHAFAAEQFLHLVVSGPRRRALGLGRPLGPDEVADWARRSVALFLDGCRT